MFEKNTLKKLKTVISYQKLAKFLNSFMKLILEQC
jgi:hypothetical protein